MPAIFNSIAPGAVWVLMSLLVSGLALADADDLPAHGLQAAYEVGDEPGTHEHSDRPTIPLPQHPELTTAGRAYDALFTRQHATDSWWGLRPALDNRGIVLDASWTLDLSRNFRGGVSTSETNARYLFDVNLTVDTERLWDWPGGTLFVDFQSFGGRAGDRIVGDYQVFSNIDSVPVTQVPQVWFEQTWWDSALRWKVGMVDANSEFAYVEHGAAFLNSSMGFSPTVFVLPTYPDPSTSINVFWDPTGWLHFGAGLYDGAGQRGVPTGSRGPRSLLGEKLFTIGEVAVQWRTAANLAGRSAAGAWYHNGDFETFAGGRQSGTSGWYWLAEQHLFRELPADDDDSQGISAFVQLGQADAEVSEVRRHAGAGLVWQGLLPGRDDDAAGLGVTRVQFSNQAGLGFSTETATEAYYLIQLTPWAGITLDLQHVRHPGGVAGRRDAWVGTSRFVFQF